jgi:radical SAM superfamily enzyme YgiQ (UPF0313 family)
VNVLLLYPRYPQHTFWNVDASARAFGGARGTMAPLGLLTVAGYLPDDFAVRLVDRNVREETEADWAWADVVFLSLMLAQQDDYRDCVRQARDRGVPVAVGGPYTSALPERAASEADWVCLGEAETIMESLVADLRADRRGRRYEGGHETDMESVRTPRYELIEDAGDYYVMPVQFSRGCPYTCEFCDIIEIYGRVPRTKTPSQVLVELEAIRDTGFRGCIFIVDDNFIGNRKRAEEMLHALAGWNEAERQPFFYFTEASINLGDHPKLLDAMERAGFVFVFIGIETPDEGLLRTTKKIQNTSGDLLERIATIRGHGIHVIAGMVVGFDGEDRHVFERQRAFIEESGIGVVLFGVLQALPNTQLTRRLAAAGRLLADQPVHLNHTIEGMNFVPKSELSKREYLAGLIEILEEIYAPEAFFRRVVPAHLSIRRSTPAPVKLAYVRSLLRLIHRMGVRERALRRPFWRALLRIATRNPRALGAFYYDCFHYDHLARHRGEVRRAISAYLASPAPGDVLDEVFEETAAERPRRPLTSSSAEAATQTQANQSPSAV